MADPPRDSFGKVEPHDDPDILDTDGLLRNIPPQWLILNKNTQQRQLSSAAFQGGRDGGMSVNLERLMFEAGLSDDDSAPSSSHGIVRLVAGEVRSIGMKVGSDPLQENPYHGQVWELTRSRRRQLTTMFRWVRYPKNGL